MQWLTRFFKKGRTEAPARPVQIFLQNTLTGKKEVFIPLKPHEALMYSCGPTVYGPVHIGNLRAYVFTDTLARALEAAGYRVRRVINITDFGHLVSDSDEGEDKMTKGLKREGLTLTLENMRMMAERYATQFIDELSTLNIDTASILFPRASDFIPEQIALINTLVQKEYAYRTSEGVYFDTSRFHTYGKLGGLALDAQQEGARIKQREKRNPADFVLWKPDNALGWESPWGLGFPGWHIECSAMSRSLLGQEIDIHTGGVDNIPIHHNNEIAQSEAASGRQFVRYWLHNAFLTAADGEKASKSVGNVVYLPEVLEKGYHPLALRYFYLQAHYRTPLSFSWDALAGASTALTRLWKVAEEIATESSRVAHRSDAELNFLAAMRDDLATPQAVAVLWETLKSEDYTPEEKWGLLEVAEAHLGLALTNPPVHGPAMVAKEEIPTELADLLALREAARAARDFALADQLRAQIAERGYRVDDGPNGPMLTRHD